MKYLVMETHPAYAVLLDEEGRFLKAANLHYEVGQTVYDPVLMRDKPEKRFRPVRWVTGGAAAIAACFLLVFGINYYQNHLMSYSSIYLTINPEVQLQLNRKGSVVRLDGINEDGEALLEGYDGKDFLQRAGSADGRCDSQIYRWKVSAFLSEGLEGAGSGRSGPRLAQDGE